MINCLTEPFYPLNTPTAKNFVYISTPSNSSRVPLSPSSIAQAYSVSLSSDSGQGICVAVIDAFQNDTLQRDFNAFGRTFSLPQNSLEVYYPDGKSTIYSESWALEAATDTQWVYAIVPRARIMCVFAIDARIESLFSAAQFAVDQGADVISISWGSDEFLGQDRYSSIMGSTDKIFVASAGDIGAKVVFPSSSAQAVSVGGTVLHINSSQRVFERTAWENGGGGPSLYTPIPYWQKKFKGIPELSGSFRATPDIALNASQNPGYAVYSSSHNGIIGVGGTSVAAPVFAGICARLLSENPQALSGKTMSQYLYELAGETEYSFPQYYFEDIVIGSNTKYSALPGYDLCTGLGAPIASQIIGS